MSRLFRVTYIRQDNGEEDTHYVMAEDANTVMDGYADVIRIEPLSVEQL